MITFLKCLGLIIGGLILSKIFLAIAGWDINRQHKKEQERYKMYEAKRKAEYEEMVRQAERDAATEAKLKKMREEYKAQNKTD